MSKEDFKLFVRKNPGLLNSINNQSMTWQKFYEMYTMYGEESSVWNPYIEKNEPTSTKTSASSALIGDTSIKDLFNMVKKVDLETVRKGVDGLQKAITLVQGFGSNSSTTAKDTYQTRPMYKYFED